MEFAKEPEVEQAAQQIQSLSDTLNQVLFGQEALVDLVITGLLARGHILLEGLPGLGKTELVKGLSHALGLDTKRIQFTPDLLPGDITGNPVLQEIDNKRSFVFQPGPLFTNIVLADEINRASPKTQSALLEAMQEHRVTVLGETHPLPLPFFVLATQNPIELEGTYPLPEAQLDRFLFKLDVKRNSVDTLEKIVNQRELGTEPETRQVVDQATLQSVLDTVRAIYLPDVVANYIARLVDATHHGQSKAASSIKFGASPRAALSMASAAKARALINSRTNASFEDVKFVAKAVLRHRILLEYNAKIEGETPDSVIEKILNEVPFQNTKTPKHLTNAN
ncbi:MoxR-like ATPase [Rubritalea squalenifaciens DSM 18772]|uniref:MoxR-like ATPase n=1 Tax=Rubritalea squalenifaciens DSM 18772 TaxID=1123071 RepID=A0A1M6HXU0_9BACT|nr:MoxR family ATPase [Rubritalea squalenifaciens]SHJ27031.1 MoxR-like ATPase [Rubritalea squalenifaciens DSM 18772]